MEGGLGTAPPTSPRDLLPELTTRSCAANVLSVSLDHPGHDRNSISPQRSSKIYAKHCAARHASRGPWYDGGNTRPKKPTRRRSPCIWRARP